MTKTTATQAVVFHLRVSKIGEDELVIIAILKYPLTKDILANKYLIGTNSGIIRLNKVE
jgi:hypothetical protein